MKSLRIPASLLLLILVTACVTINVYFPAEAAEKAADRIILDVYGNVPARPEKPPEPQGSLAPAQQLLGMLLERLVKPAYAAADLSVNTPAIRQLTASMETRHRALSPYYASGAIGMTDDGRIAMRDQKLVPLAERNSAKGLVAQENSDREALYAEIARANGHPEWEAEIRATFARRWVDNAPRGWWYMDAGGGWKQK